MCQKVALSCSKCEGDPVLVDIIGRKCTELGIQLSSPKPVQPNSQSSQVFILAEHSDDEVVWLPTDNGILSLKHGEEIEFYEDSLEEGSYIRSDDEESNRIPGDGDKLVYVGQRGPSSYSPCSL